MYIAFLRPLLEYGDSIWDNCTQADKYELYKIQNEAARIATGATKLVSINNLYKEICWESLIQKRRNDHKLILFFKMYNHLAPVYLSSLIPQKVNDISCYNLLNSNNIQTYELKQINAIIPFYPPQYEIGITYLLKLNMPTH